MKKTFICIVFFLLFSTVLPVQETFARDLSSDTSANLATPSAFFVQQVDIAKKDYRIDVLTKYLKKMNSPLADHAEDFIKSADEYNLPWNLVVAIAGTESTLGQEAPANCFNYYGFGIYGNQVKCFSSIQEGVHTVSKALREDYINKWNAQSVEAIGSIYAASPLWSAHTQYFLKQMEDFKAQYENQSLPISL